MVGILEALVGADLLAVEATWRRDSVAAAARTAIISATAAMPYTRHEDDIAELEYIQDEMVDVAISSCGLPLSGGLH